MFEETSLILARGGCLKSLDWNDPKMPKGQRHKYFSSLSKRMSPMVSLEQYLIFKLEGHQYTLPLSKVDRVVSAVYVTPLPKASEVVLGIINIQGQVIPVINLRKRFRLSEREVEPSDQFII